MSSNFEQLESRRHFAVDIGVSFSFLNNEVPRYVIPSATTKFKSQFVIFNSGTALPRGAKPADVRIVLRPTGGGADVTIGVVKGSVVAGIKAGKSKLFNQAITIKPNTVPQSDYRLVLTFDGTSIGDSQPENNSSQIFNNLTTVTANPPGPMDGYGIGNKVTFTKTGVAEGNGVAGLVHEVGTFRDSRGNVGGYDVAIQNPRFPLPGTLDFSAPGVSGNNSQFFFNTKKLRTLNKVTLEFTNIQAGSIGFIQRHQDGGIYFKVAR